MLQSQPPGDLERKGGETDMSIPMMSLLPQFTAPAKANSLGAAADSHAPADNHDGFRDLLHSIASTAAAIDKNVTAGKQAPKDDGSQPALKELQHVLSALSGGKA